MRDLNLDPKYLLKRWGPPILLLLGLAGLCHLDQSGGQDTAGIPGGAGEAFEKAVVTEIIQDNLMPDGSRVGNTFGQAVFQKSFGDKFSTKALAKYAYYVTRYVNNDETQIHVDNTYRQQEMYFSTSNVYEILSKWSVSMSYDFKWNKLNANMVDFAFPHRYSNFVSLATALTLSRIQAQASLVEQVVNTDFSKSGNVIIGKANNTGDTKAHVRMITSALTMAELANEETVKNTLNALANKLYYTASTTGENNLDGTVEIAEGLTTGSYVYRKGDIAFLVKKDRAVCLVT